MSIQRRMARFDPKTVYFRCVFFTCSFINYACPNFRTTCAMALHHEFQLSTLPSIPSNGHAGGLC